MKLHRATRSDWSEVAPVQRNIWQRWAAASHGVITPGNIVSFIGVVLVVSGLYDLEHSQLIGGTAFLLIGRLADILDGLVADYTKTKSPLGEAVDATVDKILIVAALYVLIDKQLIPLLVGAFMAVHAVYAIGVSSVARKIRVDLHPSRAGKLGAFFEWTCVGLYLLGDILNSQHHSTSLTRGVAAICFAAFVVTAVISSLNYTRTAYYKRTMN